MNRMIRDESRDAADLRNHSSDVESYGPLTDKVSCGLEGCKTPHKRGFIVSFCESRDAPSEMDVVGHVCGKNAFGTGGSMRSGCMTLSFEPWRWMQPENAS